MLALEFPPVSHLFEWKEILFKDTPFAVNKTVILIWVSVALVLALFVAGTRRKALVPSGSQTIVEAGYQFVHDEIALGIIGPKGAPWTPFLTTLFFFILAINVWEIIPFIQFPPASRMAIPAYLAAQTWLVFVVLGFKHQGPKYVVNVAFPPGVPKALYLIVTPIEIVSTFIVRPFSLAVRLFANMMAGHLLLTTFYILSAALWIKAPALIILPLPALTTVALTGFELLVAVLQAYIFTMLTAVYIGDSMSAHH